jgi:hypothetical protein
MDINNNKLTNTASIGSGSLSDENENENDSKIKSYLLLATRNKIYNNIITKPMFNNYLNINPNNNNNNNLIKNIQINRNFNESDVISYQRVKRIFKTQTNITNEQELLEEELLANHLKNVDWNKYTFENEFKPKTDYTYTRT